MTSLLDQKYQDMLGATNALSPQAAFILKKFNKTNETTLIRALEELKQVILTPEFLQTKQEQQAFSIHWSNIFTTLSIHKSSNVRLNLFLCLGDGFLKCQQGKNVIGYGISDIISWWLLACSDSVSDVSGAAKNALNMLAIEGRTRVITQNISRILKLISSEDHDIVSRIGCLETVFPNIDIPKLSEIGKNHLYDALSTLLDAGGVVPDEVYFNTLSVALHTAGFMLMDRSKIIADVITQSLKKIQPFSKHARYLIQSAYEFIQIGGNLEQDFYKELLEFVSTACLGSLNVFPILRKFVPLLKNNVDKDEYLNAVLKGCMGRYIRGAQRAIVILHVFEVIETFEMEAHDYLVSLMKSLLEDSGSIIVESGYSGIGVFLTKLSKRKELQGVLSSAVTMLRHCDEKDYSVAIKNMKFIVECVERNEFTQGFSYDLLATIIEKNTLNYPFTNEEVQVLLEVLKRYPAPQFVYDMLVRQFQYIFMLTIEHTADDIELLYDDVEIEDEFMDYVEQMEDLVISSISYLPSFEIGGVLNSVFFRLFPTHFGYNHLNYLEAMIIRLKKLDMIQHCVLPLEQQIDVLLHSFQSTKHIIHSLVDVKQPLLNPVQLVKLLTTSSLDHLQLLLSVDIIEHLSTFHPFISPLIKHILELVATPNLFHYTHVSLRKTLLKLLPLFLNIVGLEPLRLMTKQILTCGNATNFIIESCKIIPDLQCVIDDAIALYPIQQFNEMIISYASTIKTPLLVPTPKELIDAVPVTYIHTISLIVSLFHLKDNPITNPQYFDYYLIDIYQKLSNGIPIEKPKTTPLDAIQRFLSKNEIEKYILFHAINELKEWFNSSQECIEFIAQHYDTSTSYSTRFFFSSYLSPLHVEWLEKKIGGTVKRFFMANIKPDLEGLQELSVMYPIIQFPSHLRPLLKYMFNVSITKNQQLPFLHLLYHCFSTSCSLCFESLEDEEMLSQIYQFLLSILEIDNHTIKRAVLKLSQILLTHSLPPKLLTSNTEGIVLSFRVTLLEFITESILKNSNIELVSEILLESELLSEIDFLSTSLPKHIPELLKILTGKAPILVKICAGQLLGATMNFSNENVYIDMDDFEKQNYKPLPQPIETFFDKSISMFSKNSVKSKQALIIFVLGLLRRLKNSSSDCKPWAVAYLTLHNIEQFIHSLYAVLPNQSTPTSLSQVISIIRSVDEDEYLGILGLYCMFNLVQVLPNVVRQWCISLKRNAPKKVKEFFGKNICGPVLEDEVQKILSWKEIDGFKLKLQLDCKAVTVVYTNDELVFETQLTFPQTYPLDMINVNIGTNKVGVSDAKSYLWKRMLTLNLMTRDVSIVDACLLWKQQLDKQFDDSDACPICYSLFYLRTTTIPNVSCKCCRKKFHKQCIFGWFRSTGRNDCPLCTRNFYGNN